VAYASSTELQTAAGGAERLVQVFDWDNDGVADAAVISQVQTEVEGWMDSYIGRRHAVPLASPSAVTRMHAAEEAVYRARLKRTGVSDEERTAHEGREKWLEMAAKGLVVVSDPLPAAASTIRSAWVSRDTDDVSREKMKGAW
jgi:phage gp36-like protein